MAAVNYRNSQMFSTVCKCSSEIALGNQKELIRQPYTKTVAKRQHCAYLLSKKLLCMFYFLMADSSSTRFAVRKTTLIN